jgi:hypothetical protein
MLRLKADPLFGESAKNLSWNLCPDGRKLGKKKEEIGLFLKLE